MHHVRNLHDEPLHFTQAYKTAVYGADFTADIDPKAPKATKRKAAEMGKAEQELADGVRRLALAVHCA